MGADLYINRLRKTEQQKWQPVFDAAVVDRNSAATEELKKKAQERVDEAYAALYADHHYFRDSYNGTGIFSLIGRSWWQDCNPDTDSDNDPDGNNMSPAACLALDKLVRDAGPPPIQTLDSLTRRNCTVNDGDSSLDAWNKFYQEKYQRLLDFLERAAANGGMLASC